MVRSMRVLLAIDGSDHSHAALAEVASRRWPDRTKIEVLTVVRPQTVAAGGFAHAEPVQEQRRNAPDLLARAVKSIKARAPRRTVVAKIIEGTPHATILQEAQRLEADLIVLGSHGFGPFRRGTFGSVAAAVALGAHCAVEIIRMDALAVPSLDVDRETVAISVHS